MTRFANVEMVAGCCGYDGLFDYRGAANDAGVASALNQYVREAEDEAEEWDDFLEEWVRNSNAILPIVLASSVEQEDGKDSCNYITPAVKWAVDRGWAYVRLPAHRNSNTQRMVAMAVLYPPEIEMDTTLMGDNL